jgi:citrate lyase beta subunit
VAEDRASITYEGKMIDYAMAARARQVLALADLIRANEVPTGDTNTRRKQ